MYICHQSFSKVIIKILFLRFKDLNKNKRKRNKIIHFKSIQLDVYEYNAIL